MRIHTRQNPYLPADWQAIDLDTYDAHVEDGEWVSGSPVGHGRSEQEAIDDLMNQLEDTAEQEGKMFPFLVGSDDQ